MVIYKIENLKNGKIYIGQTVRDLSVRIEEHLRHDNSIVGKAIKKYGMSQFEINKIDEAASIDELNRKEIHWISTYGCVVPNGYNQCSGGDNTMGYFHKEESKKKMSVSKRNMYIGDGNPFYGRTHSEESKKKMSKKRKYMAHLSDRQVKKLRESHHTVRVRNVETGEVFNSIKSAGEKYNIEPTHISRVCRGKRKTTGGYHWEYV